MISILINTVNRYENIKKILDIQCTYNEVDEIIVFNNGSQIIDDSNKKIKVIKTNWDVGLRSRWILGTLAKNDCIVFQDDDVIIPESLLKIMYGHFLFDKSRVYGIFGRNIDILNSYNPTEICYGQVDIILTRLALTNKHIIPYLFEAEEKILPFRYPGAKEYPYDDILLSYVCKTVYSKKPLAIKCSEIQEIENLETAETGLHSSKDFMKLRTNIIKACREKLCYETIHHIEQV